MEYEIQVHGPLHPQTADWLGALTVQASAAGLTTTTLRGPLPDQAALLGVLACLHNWQVEILAVIKLNPQGIELHD